MKTTSSNSHKSPDLKPLFWSQPENQFWYDPEHRPPLTAAAIDRLNALVREFENSKKVLPTVK